MHILKKLTLLCLILLTSCVHNIEDIALPFCLLEAADKDGFNLNCKRNDLNLLSEISIRSKIPGTINHVDPEGNTPLHAAAKNQPTESWYVDYFNKKVKILLNAGADVNIKDFKGNTPLHYCLKQASCRKGAEELLDLLYSAKPDMSLEDSNGNTPLQICIQQELPDSFIKKTILAGADINVKYPREKHPFHSYLSKYKVSEEIVNLFMESNLDIQSSDSADNNSTVLLAQKGNGKMFSTALRMGGVFKCREKSAKGLLPFREGVLDVMKEENLLSNEYFNHFLYKEALRKDTASLKKIVKLKVPIKDEDKQRLLFYAAEFGHEDCIESLIDFGCNINGDSQYSPLDTALAFHKNNFATRLVDLGADLDHPSVVFLVGQGADTKVKTNDDSDALHLASHLSQKDIFYFLNSHSS